MTQKGKNQRNKTSKNTITARSKTNKNIEPQKSLKNKSQALLPNVAPLGSVGNLEDKEDQILKGLQPIFNLLRTQFGHDFSLYKPNTICRRIEKRMNLHQINSIYQYAKYLQNNPQEVEILFNDLLIGVTHFFRNPEAFEALKKVIIDKLLKQKPKDACIRIWVPACATGEEAYSLAILLQECMEEEDRYYSVQIFGTDIDEAAIEIARAGIYSASILETMDPTLLKKYFVQEDKMYKISKNIRKMVIFAVQNIIKDPPFIKLDLLSCRNLLIYFSSELQKKLIPMFYYSLNCGGILFLGSAENIEGFTDLFNTLDKKWKIFDRQEGVLPILQTTLHFPTSLQHDKMEKLMQPKIKTTIPIKENNLAESLKTILLENYAPTCIIVNEDGDIIYIHGRTGKYLEPPSGAATLNILQMARPGLKSKLATALRQVANQKKQVTYKNLQTKEENSIHYFNLQIRLFKEFDPDKNWRLIILEEVEAPQYTNFVHSKRISHDKLLKKLAGIEQELKQSKENLQTTIEELETSNEELKSSNEELQSTNEELQSTNEELETSKEELQSLNEELTTVNAELEAGVDELSSTNDDIQNLLYSTEIAAIFLNNELRIKRYTPKATELTNLIPADIGRPICDIVSKLKYDNLVDDAQNVLETLSCKITEVQSKELKWYQVRIIPYRTLSNMIDGLVITFLNIDTQKQAEEKVFELNSALQRLSEYITLLINNVRDPLLFLDEKFKILKANTALCNIFKTTTENIQGHSIYDLLEKNTDIAKLRQLLEVLLPEKRSIRNLEKNLNFNNQTRKFIFNANMIDQVNPGGPAVFLILETTD